MPVQNLLPKDGVAQYFPGLFSPEESASYFDLLRKEIQWHHEPIKIFGKSILQPRLTAWFDDQSRTYSYSGITMHPQKWPVALLEIRDRVQKQAGAKFSSVLLNLYRDGADSMGWHQDNEKELGINPLIGSVSFGAERVFQLKHIKDPEAKVSVQLQNGSFLLMAGETQHHWKHQIPKSKQILGPRINLTFRILF